MADRMLEIVREKYAAAAQSDLNNQHQAVREVAEGFGYSRDELASIPEEANLGLSCGNPTALAQLQPGEVVVDLGCGGGLDVFLAAQRVGPAGKAIGIDMTPEMIDRARAGAAKLSGINVEFHLTTIDHLPLPDASVDCVISNCVVNLAPDKRAVFREIHRILKPGGRLAITDIALKRELPKELAQSVSAYVGCIAGALTLGEWSALLQEVGFQNVRITDQRHDLNAYAKIEGQSACCSPGMDSPCCAPSASDETVHLGLKNLLSQYDINHFAASIAVEGMKKPATNPDNA